MENFIKEIQSSLAPFKELFILLGVIILVWAIVALIIKKIIRKADISEDSESNGVKS